MKRTSLPLRRRAFITALYDLKGRYRYWAGFNPIAVAWTAIGFLICTYVVPTARIPALATLLISGGGYLLTVRLMQPAGMRDLAQAWPGRDRNLATSRST